MYHHGRTDPHDVLDIHRIIESLERDTIAAMLEEPAARCVFDVYNVENTQQAASAKAGRQKADVSTIASESRRSTVDKARSVTSLSRQRGCVCPPSLEGRPCLSRSCTISTNPAVNTIGDRHMITVAASAGGGCGCGVCVRMRII